ncbi:hypothetical protein BDA99DRAFT_541763 [Phascolomyces articulosus]|uniref:Galactose oxidase n=1 Tax=Phascolomyces articulosus TaxID=60185 RepID=A0AAD5K0Q5_9FUNG|nr:hypothetical protein BDA99DRAFT_541763 [Phascolomyces articulosus]
MNIVCLMGLISKVVRHFNIRHRSSALLEPFILILKIKRHGENTQGFLQKKLVLQFCGALQLLYALKNEFSDGVKSEWSNETKDHDGRLTQYLRTIVSAPLLLFTIIILFSIFDVSRGEYPSNSSNPTAKISDTAGFTINGKMYTYGGRNFNSPTSVLYEVNIDMNNGVMTRTVVDSSGMPTYDSQAIILDNDTVAFIGGSLNWARLDPSSMPSLIGYTYSFSQQSWNSLPGLNDSRYSLQTHPEHRQGHTAVKASDGLIYIQGGTQNAPYNSILLDAWSYEASTGDLKKLDDPPFGLFAATATALPDGPIVYLGGYYDTVTLETLPVMFRLDRALIYDINSNSWRTQPLNTTAIKNFTLERENLSAVLGPENRYIYVFGGDTPATENNKMMVYNDLWILDTHTWTWGIPSNVSGTQPITRTGSSAALINNDYIYFCYGRTQNFAIESIDVLKLPDISKGDESVESGPYKWLYNISTGETQEEAERKPSGPSKGVIIGLSVGFGVSGLICIILLFLFRHRVKYVMIISWDAVWDRRIGEPLWAEISRFITGTFLVLLFIAFVVFLVVQVINSPVTSDSRIESAEEKGLDVPDIRFCFDGYSNDSDPYSPHMSCETDIGGDCQRQIMLLDRSKHSPLPVTSTFNRCFLFLSDDLTDNIEPIRLSPTRIPGVNNGTIIGFTPRVDNVTEPVRLFMSFYHPREDPNRHVYINEPNIQLDDEYIENWKYRDSSYVSGESLEPMESANIQYSIEVTKHLTKSWWNFVGFASIYNQTTEVKTTIQKYKWGEPQPGTYGTVGSILLTPSTFDITVNKEQRVYTLVNAFGFVGGIYGLFIAFQSAMFGYRPQSPFGYLHRWSVGPMRRSIYRGLKDGFKDYRSPTPMVNPVHARQYSNYTNNEKVDAEDGIIHLKNIGMGFNAHSSYASDETDAILTLERGSRDDENGEKYVGGDSDDHGRRVESMEDRMQLLEKVFQSYYIDDEVFQKLDKAVKYPDKSNKRRHRAGASRRQHNVVGILGGRRDRAGYKRTQSIDSRYTVEEDEQNRASIKQPPTMVFKGGQR